MKIRNFFFKNFFAKIVCILLAIGFWIYVGTGQTKSAQFPGKIPVEVKNTPQGLIAVLSDEEISIKVMAEGSVYSKLNTDSFSAYIDLAGYKEGTFNIKPVVVAKIGNVAVIETNPKELVVNLEQSATKEVPIVPIITGKAGEGLVSGQATVDPSRATVSGARSVINKILEANVKIQLTGQTADFKQTAKLYSLNALGKEYKGLIFTPSEVIVNIPIVKSSNVKTVGIKANIIGAPADGYWISEINIDPQNITITANEELLKQIAYISTDEISASGINKSVSLKINLKPTSGVSILDSIGQVKVSIIVSKGQTSRELNVGFSPSGLAGNLKITSYDPISVRVLANGASDVINSLTSRDLSIILNLSDYNQAGTYAIDISRADVSGPVGVSVSSIMPSVVSVKLETR